MKIFSTRPLYKVNFKRWGYECPPEIIKEESHSFFENENENENNIESGYQLKGGGYIFYSLNDLKRKIGEGYEGLLERIALEDLKSEARKEFQKAINTAKEMCKKGV